MDEHEMASQVLEIIDRAAYRNAVHHVVAVHLEIGGRRGLNLDRLIHDFEVAARGTVAEGARLEVRVLPVRHHCHNCGSEFEADASDRPCPRCGHPHTEAVSGEEARVVDMEVDS